MQCSAVQSKSWENGDVKECSDMEWMSFIELRELVEICVICMDLH